MDQVDQTQKYSNSSSGGGVGVGGVARSSKKLKQKKVPQRGLGVAQLEKIRLEEQQKKEATAILSPLSPSKSSFLSLQIPTYHHFNPSSSSIPSPSPFPADLSLPNLVIRPPQPVQNNDVRNSSMVNSGGFEAGWSGISVPGHGCVPKLWNSYEYNLERENSGLDPGLAFRSNLNLPYESDNHIWPPPSLMPRTQQYQQQPMVNVSSGTSSSSMQNFRMEPPSNQSYYCNYTPMWPEEEKMVGMKRPYPFSLNNSPGPSFNYKLPTLVAPIRSDESTSCENGGTFNFETSNTILREGPSWSTSNSKLNSNKSIKENEVLKGEFLSLSPPRITPICPSSTFMHHSACLASQDPKLPDFESLPYQGNAEDPIIQPAGLSLLNQQQPFYCFLPSTKVQIGQATTTMNNCNGEVGESIDLNLKL